MSNGQRSKATWVFEERAVAFLDILGFSALIAEAEKQSESLQSLFGLRAILDSHVRWDNQELDENIPNEVKPRYIFISDSIILSVPLRHENYDGLAIVAVKTIQITHKLLEMGYLLRGGISVGPVWHDDRNIFGTGYIEAVNAEKKAKHPRVLLTEKAVAHWEESDLSGTPLTDTHICMSDDQATIVDTLCPEYIRDLEEHGRLEDALNSYRVWILLRLETLSPAHPGRGKWEWFGDFFNRALIRYRIDTVRPIDTFPFPK